MDENRAEGAPGKAEGIEGDARKLADKAKAAIGGVSGDTNTQAEGRVHEVAGEGQQKSSDAKDIPVEAADNTADEPARR